MGGGKGIGAFTGTKGSGNAPFIIGENIVGVGSGSGADTRATHGLFIRKVDFDTLLPISGGAKFSVALHSEKPFVVKTNLSGVAIIKNAISGVYGITEIEAPIGYLLNDKTYRVEHQEGEKTSIDIPNKSIYSQQTLDTS